MAGTVVRAETAEGAAPAKVDEVAVLEEEEDDYGDDEFETEELSDHVGEAEEQHAAREPRPMKTGGANDELLALGEENSAKKGVQQEGLQKMDSYGENFFSLAPDGLQGGAALHGKSIDWADLKGLKQFEGESDTTSMQVQDSTLGEDPRLDDFVAEKPDPSPLGGYDQGPPRSGVDPFAEMFGEVALQRVEGKEENDDAIAAAMLAEAVEADLMEEDFGAVASEEHAKGGGGSEDIWEGIGHKVDSASDTTSMQVQDQSILGDDARYDELTSARHAPSLDGGSDQGNGLQHTLRRADDYGDDDDDDYVAAAMLAEVAAEEMEGAVDEAAKLADEIEAAAQVELADIAADEAHHVMERAVVEDAERLAREEDAEGISVTDEGSVELSLLAGEEVTGHLSAEKADVLGVAVEMEEVEIQRVATEKDAAAGQQFILAEELKNHKP